MHIGERTQVQKFTGVSSGTVTHCIPANAFLTMVETSCAGVGPLSITIGSETVYDIANVNERGVISSVKCAIHPLPTGEATVTVTYAAAQTFTVSVISVIADQQTYLKLLERT